jgi:ATP-binding cassette, subfamily B, multidrug efflux pump
MIKQLLKPLREFKKQTILSPAFVTLEVIMEVIIPLLMASLIDNGINAGNMNFTINIGIILVICAAVSLVFGALSGKFAATASAGYARNLRQDIYYKVQDFSFSSIDKFSAPSLVTRLTTDVTNVQNAFQLVIRIAVRAPIMLIFSLVLAFSLNSQLSLILFAAIPFLVVGIYFVMRNVHPTFRLVFKTYDKLNNVVQENVRGIRVVKSFVRENYEEEKFKKVSEDAYQKSTKAEKMVAFTMPLMQSIIYVCILLISWFGAQFIVGGSMTTGDLTAFIIYALQILISLMMLSMVILMVTISRASAERIVEVIDEKTDLHNPEKPVNNVKDGSISFQNVDFKYSKTSTNMVLAGINLDIKAGQTVGLIGGTGSSKSSLVQLIPRLYDVSGGVVKVGDVDVREYDLKTIRNEVGMVLQKNVLFSGTIKENLRWVCKDASDEELVRICKLAQADEFIRSFPNGYDTHIEQGGSNVSGGQKQRLCIARALLKRPKILIFDDSTSAVDTKTDALIRRALREEIPDTTKIIIAQRVASVQDADQIIVLDNGKINAVGTHEELLKNNQIYQEVYYSQVKGGVLVDAQ